MLVAAAALREDRTWAASLFTRFCAFLGFITYAIYLIHPFVIRGVEEVAVRTGLAAILGPVGFIMVALAGTVGGVPDLPGVRKTCDGVFAAEAGTRRHLAAGWSVLSKRQRPQPPDLTLRQQPARFGRQLKSALVMNDREDRYPARCVTVPPRADAEGAPTIGTGPRGPGMWAVEPT